MCGRVTALECPTGIANGKLVNRGTAALIAAGRISRIWLGGDHMPRRSSKERVPRIPAMSKRPWRPPPPPSEAAPGPGAPPQKLGPGRHLPSGQAGPQRGYGLRWFFDGSTARSKAQVILSLRLLRNSPTASITRGQVQMIGWAVKISRRPLENANGRVRRPRNEEDHDRHGNGVAPQAGRRNCEGAGEDGWDGTIPPRGRLLGSARTTPHPPAQTGRRREVAMPTGLGRTKQMSLIRSQVRAASL